jgi:hypothetical protein
MNGATPEETQGAAWFRKKEVGNLKLAPKFREDWEDSVCLKDNATKSLQINKSLEMVPVFAEGLKSLQRLATENGEVVIRDEPRYGAGTGSNWPYPVRADGVPVNNRPGGGQTGGEMGAIEPPFTQDDLSSRVSGSVYPRGSNDEGQPRRRGKGTPAKKLPHDPEGQWPEQEQPDSPGIGAQIVPGGPVKGVTPVTGSVAARAPEPYKPGSVPPQAFDPAENVEQLTDEGDVIQHD